MGSRTRRGALAASFVLLATLAPAPAAAGPAGPPVSPALCDARPNDTHKKLAECVTLEGVREHQAALQDIADANGGTRVSGSPGYDESVDYAAEVLTAAGYNVTVQPFEFQTFVVLSPTILEVVSPTPMVVPNNILTYSGSGDVTAPVSIPAGDHRGCNASDFAGFPAGHIALVQRGAPDGFPVACTFALKVTNAYNAGAVGVIVYNNAAGVINGTLGATFTLDIGATSVTQAVGQQLAAQVPGGLVMRLKTDTFRGIATAENVLAESKGGNPDNVVMVGAHLDSVNAGPGIQDNGSGSAAVLEVAEQMARVNTRNKVRFALWGAEEASLVGSTYYVANLSAAEKSRITLYLNFDMIGSPNHVFFVYDGDDSDAVGAGPGPSGSAQIEKTFERFYEARGIPYKGTDFSGRSDYGPFIAANIPSGGLFTGAEGIKTVEEAAIWGGTPGIQYDPCYHLACDTYDNINLAAFDINADAVAYATLQYAMNTSDVNGVKGKGNFKPPAPEPEEELATE
ncbi:MAG TPA: M28 family metallopeptidase [Clostridia bacterium]|nr:M28 family metallopeptidase [Clostridia bacterium]